MAGRRTTARVRCPHPECTEVGFFDYSTQRDAREGTAYRQDWRCTRHRKPEEVLTPDNTIRTMVATAEKSKRFPNLTQLFWRDEGADDAGSGFTFGPGFKAWADDFPEGTRLVVTATVEAPAPLTGVKETP